MRKVDRINLLPGKLNPVELARGEHSGSVLVEVLEDGNLVLEFEVEGWDEELINPIRQPVAVRRVAGHRALFLCPRCDRLSTILYSNPYFMCRACLGLRYASQSQSRAMRRLIRALQQRMKMGGTSSPWDPFPPRPKGMRHATYSRLKQEDDQIILPYLSAQMDSVDRLLGSMSSKSK